MEDDSEIWCETTSEERGGDSTDASQAILARLPVPYEREMFAAVDEGAVAVEETDVGSAPPMGTPSSIENPTTSSSSSLPTTASPMGMSYYSRYRDFSALAFAPLGEVGGFPREILISVLKSVIKDFIRDHGTYFRLVMVIPRDSIFNDGENRSAIEPTGRGKCSKFEWVPDENDDLLSHATHFVGFEINSPNYRSKTRRGIVLENRLRELGAFATHQSSKNPLSDTFVEVYEKRAIEPGESRLLEIPGGKVVVIGAAVPSFRRSENFLAKWCVPGEDWKTGVDVLTRAYKTMFDLFVSYRIQMVGPRRIKYFALVPPPHSYLCYLPGGGLLVDPDAGRAQCRAFYAANFEEKFRNAQRGIYMIEFVDLDDWERVKYRYVGSTENLKKRFVGGHLRSFITGDDRHSGAYLCATVGHEFYMRFRTLDFVRLRLVSERPNGWSSLSAKYEDEHQAMDRYCTWAGVGVTRGGGLNIALPWADERSPSPRLNKHLPGFSASYIIREMEQYNPGCALQYLTRQWDEDSKGHPHFAAYLASLPGNRGRELVKSGANLFLPWSEIKRMTFGKFKLFLMERMSAKLNRHGEVVREAQGERRDLYIFLDALFVRERHLNYWPPPVSMTREEEEKEWGSSEEEEEDDVAKRRRVVVVVEEESVTVHGSPLRRGG